MPNRIIRESCRSSPTLAMLTAEAERLFWRLTTVADDHGRFEAEPMVVMADCFKAMLHKVRITQVAKWLDELRQVRLIDTYRVGEKTIGIFTTWGAYQRMRKDRGSKYPPPSAVTGGQVPPPAACSTEVQKYGVGSTEVQKNNTVSADAATDIIAWLNKKAGRTFEARTPAGRPTANLELVLARLREGREPWQLKAIVSRKVREWSGTEMAKYLRPATLFNRVKCEQYIGELPPAEAEHGHD